MIRSAVLPFLLAVFIQGSFSIPFLCGAGVCNLPGDADQFCSQDIEPTCVPCRDVDYSCFKQTMPYNCTNYCLRKHDAHLKDKPCPRLRIANGFHNASSVERPGNKVLVECDTGFHLKGNSIITCLPFGYWSQQMPTCERTTTATLSTLGKILLSWVVYLLIILGIVMFFYKCRRIRNPRRNATLRDECPNVSIGMNVQPPIQESIGNDGDIPKTDFPLEPNADSGYENTSFTSDEGSSVSTIEGEVTHKKVT